ncbi:MAG: hypothetical protein ACREPR_00910 [Brasilonema sp.]
MSQSPITVTYSLEEILARIEGKIDDLKADGAKLSEQIKNVEIGQARIIDYQLGRRNLTDEQKAYYQRKLIFLSCG